MRLAHDPRRSSVRRVVFTDAMLTLWTAVTGINWLGNQIDERRYADYRDVPLGKPIYIVAAPRSGTTFLHRLMSLDPQFTALKMHETILYSISTQRALARLGRQNGVLRRAFDRAVDTIDQRYFGGWEGKHDTGITQPEEDEALWALALATPALWLVFPEPKELDDLRFVDRWPEAKRQKLVEYYRAALQRHLYLNSGKTLLGKNVFLPGRYQLVRRAVPEARFIHVIRHPYEALSSMLSLFTMPWRYTAPGVDPSGPEAHALADLMIDYYRCMHTESQRSQASGEHSFVTVRYQDLLTDPERTVRGIYEYLEMPLSPDFEHKLLAQTRQQRAFRSTHNYSMEQFGLCRDRVYRSLRDVFEEHGFER